jgi:hypothetical protein
MITSIVLASIEVVLWLVILGLRTKMSTKQLFTKAHFEYIMVLYAAHFFKMMFINGAIALGMILYIARNGGVGAPDPDVTLDTSLFIWWHLFLIYSLGGATYAIASASDAMVITGIKKMFCLFILIFLKQDGVCYFLWDI